MKEDYDYALRFLEALRSTWTAALFVLAPGNHDVNREAEVGREQEEYARLLERFFGDKLGKSYPFLAPEGREDLDPRQALVSIDELPGHALIVSVNSAAHLTDGPVPVYVDHSVLERVQEELAEREIDPGLLRMFVVHHHLMPFAEPIWEDTTDPNRPSDRPDPTIVANSAKLQTWLADNDFHLVFHGHKHISHGREDTLWKRDDASGRRLIVLGAGSAGVFDQERPHGEPLSYNVVEVTRRSRARWDVEVKVRRINDAAVPPKALDGYPFHARVGRPVPEEVQAFFHAERMDDCHRAIHDSAAGRGKIRNFLSIVEGPEYIHPPTVRRGAREATEEEVRESFSALHPEHRAEHSWEDAKSVGMAISNLPARFQFSHGPRMFGVLGRAGSPFGQQDDQHLRPMYRAVQSLRSGSDSKAYVGLYNAQLDSGQGREPLPGLMGVQFVPDGDCLDAVATFRKVELSFWWAVNMLEIGSLLRWAAEYGEKTYTPRRITFFAALAEWKKEPEGTFVVKLDSTPLDELCRLLLQVDAGSPDARARLVALLEEKAEKTNDANIDLHGLEQLALLVDGIVSGRAITEAVLTAKLRDAVKGALQPLRETLETEDLHRRATLLKRVKARLKEAVAQIAQGASG